MKLGIALLISLIVGIYTAFVSMCLWNWFATRALHVPELSFFEMLGLLWLLQVLFRSIGQDSEPHWRMLWTLLDKLVPDNRRDAYAAAMNEMEQDVWTHATVGAIDHVVDNTLMLGLGFSLHLMIV
jgi:hypothetical protein